MQIYDVKSFEITYTKGILPGMLVTNYTRGNLETWVVLFGKFYQTKSHNAIMKHRLKP